MGRYPLRRSNMRINKPESYAEIDGKLYYIAHKDGGRRSAEIIVGRTKTECG